MYVPLLVTSSKFPHSHWLRACFASFTVDPQMKNLPNCALFINPFIQSMEKRTNNTTLILCRWHFKIFRSKMFSFLVVIDIISNVGVFKCFLYSECWHFVEIVEVVVSRSRDYNEVKNSNINKCWKKLEPTYDVAILSFVACASEDRTGLNHISRKK